MRTRLPRSAEASADEVRRVEGADDLLLFPDAAEAGIGEEAADQKAGGRKQHRRQQETARSPAGHVPDRREAEEAEAGREGVPPPARPFFLDARPRITSQEPAPRARPAMNATRRRPISW